MLSLKNKKKNSEVNIAEVHCENVEFSRIKQEKSNPSQFIPTAKEFHIVSFS